MERLDIDGSEWAFYKSPDGDYCLFDEAKAEITAAYKRGLDDAASHIGSIAEHCGDNEVASELFKISEQIRAKKEVKP